MIVADAPAIWLPPAPAIIRPAEHRLLSPGYLPATRAERRRALADLLRSGKLTKQQAANALVVKLPPVAMLMLNQLVGFGAGGSAPVRTYLGRVSSSADQQNYTFNGVDIGPDNTPKLVVIVVNSRGTNTSANITGATFDGNAMTASSSNGHGASGSACENSRIFQYFVTGGTSADIAVANSAAMTVCFVDVYIITDLVSTIPFDEASTGNTAVTSQSVSVDVPQDGVLIAGSGASTTASFTWTGATEDADGQVDSRTASCASAQSLAAQSGRSVQASCGSSTVMSIAAATWA